MTQSFWPCTFLRGNTRIAVYKVKKESMFNLWWHNLLDMSEIRLDEYMYIVLSLFTKRKDHGWKFQNEKTTCQRQSFDHYATCQGRSLRKPNLIAIEKRYLISFCRGYSSSFIPVYEILIKCALSAKPTRAVLQTKSKSMFDEFGTCSKNKGVRWADWPWNPKARHNMSRTPVSVECCVNTVLKIAAKDPMQYFLTRP